MINFKDRLETEIKIFEKLMRQYPAQSALDAGCGSGLHTIVLSRLNLDMTGMDNSDHMLKIAKKNSKEYNLNPIFIKNSFLNLHKKLLNNFDAVFCLGNSFVHLLSQSDQITALSNFRQYLKPGGYLCIQIVNYDKIQKDKQNVLAVREVNGQKITRFYTFNRTTITFTVKVEDKSNCKEFSTELYPIQSEDLLYCLNEAGFKKIYLYGDLMFNKYKRFQSGNICVFCY